MKKHIFVVSAIAIVLIVLAFLGGRYLKPDAPAGGTSVDNLIDGLTSTATSTGGTFPIKVLDTNYGRGYALIQNDSANDVYLWFQDFTTTANASTTVAVNKGVLLKPAGHYEMLPENLIVGQVWATSTVSGSRILIIEK